MHDYLSDGGKELKKIKNGKGIQHILAEASGVLGNPILIHDMEYNLIEHSGNPITDDPVWNEIITTGTIGHESLELYKEESFLETMANTKSTAFLISDKLKYNRVFGKIYTKYDVQVGSAVIIAYDTPFDKDDTKLFEIVCEIITCELGSDEFYQNYGQTYREALISKLIEGSILDKSLYVAQVEDIYAGLGAYMHLIVADISQCAVERTNPVYFRDLFRRAEPAFKYSVHSNYILIIISTDSAAFDTNRDLKKLTKIFAENKIYAGIRSDADNLFELQKYYGDAVSALNFGMQTKGNQRIFLFNTQ